MDPLRIGPFILSSADISVSLFFLFECIGFWRILVKCGHKGYWALVPGVRCYMLGDCADREEDGMRCALLEILLLILNHLNHLAPEILDPKVDEFETHVLLGVIMISLVLALLIFTCRIYSGLCEVFERSKLWIPLWVFFTCFPALVWGFGRKFQPNKLAWEDAYDPSEAPQSLDPALLHRTAEWMALPKEEGLHINLKYRSVREFFKVKYLLRDMKLSIPNGSFVLLLGGSGSGKTTFVNAITGYEKANAVMRLNGQDIYDDYDRMKYHIGMVPQQDLLRLNDRVDSTLADAASLRLPSHYTRAQREERIQSVMKTLGLSGGKNDLVSKKSGGQKKRISIGMELISDPELFILDEPDSGLDGVIARELFERLRKVADAGNIVIAITHTPDRVADLFDKVIVLARDSSRSGRLAFYGSPADAKSFFGKSSMEQIVMAINGKGEGGEGRADEFVRNFHALCLEAAALKPEDPGLDDVPETETGTPAPEAAEPVGETPRPADEAVMEAKAENAGEEEKRDE